MIQFPKKTEEDVVIYTFDNNLNSMSTIGGLFGSRSDNVQFTTDKERMSIQTKKGTRRYSTVGVATIIVSKIKNPPHEESFGSFKISIYDQYKKLIAEVS